GSRIINTECIYNTRIGAHTHIEGVTLLEEGSVNSSADDPVRLGFNLSARHFIISSGAVLNDGVILERCFIGQGVELGKQYSAENSLFFANCIGFHGEACAVFAGPYTVTHHKSTLLISGFFSFLNAGSGSNQSNHMYKLGPIHQGIIERGSKTTSDSYLLWPAKVGPFTLVMGRHYKNSDTSLLPFSYLVENNDESILAPGVNLRSVGTIRDAQKWPRRDRRKDPVLLDQINYNLLSPFTIQKMWRGREILGNLQQASGKKSEYYFYENTKIPRSALERGIRLYTIGIRKFLGNSLISVLEKNSVKDFKNLKAKLDPVSAWGKGEWVDLSGLIVPGALVNSFSDRLEEGEITRLDEIQAEFRLWHERYYEMEWTWARDYLEREFNQTVDEMQPDDMIRIIEIWKKAVVDLDEMLYEDARKEFRLSAKTGFGTDGGEDEKLKDFEQVRGDFEQNPSVAAIRQHIIRKSELGDRMIRKIRDLR
ncbi:MAG: DUF4954 family protein, partial [Bacteroidales bacterium]|nr:DUF4954 family protein [Bacteroidales bacterium]